MIMVMGLIDDLKNLNWRLRLGIQFGCAAILACHGSSGDAVRAVHPPDPGGR